MQQLSFVTPRYDSFLKILRSLWAKEVRSIRLIGNNDLAVKIAKAAKQQGIALSRANTLNNKGSNKAQAIVFTETSGELLSAQLSACVGLDDVLVVAPITDWHFSRKPLFLVSIPKAGTHLVYELAQALGYRAGIEAPEFPLGQTWYCVEYWNSHTVARDFYVDTVRRKPFGNRYHPFMHAPTLFIYRHPLDILISEAHYYHHDGKTTFAGWLSQYNFAERVERLISDNWLIGSLRERVGGFLPWLEFPNVIPFSFEELIGAAGGGNEEDQLRLIWSIQLKLQAPGSPGEITSQVFNPDSPTFRSGQIGEYINHLPAEVISSFATQNTDILGQLGYPIDGSFGLPAQRDKRLHKAIAYSKIDYDIMPFTIEANFLDCNLVRYNKKIYAVPRAAGPIAFEELSQDTLAALPAADSLEDLKTLLTVGYSELSQRQKALQLLGTMLAEGKPVGSFHQYWNESTGPYVFDTYEGFNLVAYADHYLALRQSVGKIDLTSNSLNDLVQIYGTDAVLIAASISDLRNEIDRLTTSQRLRQEAATANEQALTKIETVQADQEKLFKRIEEHVTGERQAVGQALEQLRQEAATTDEQALTKIETVQADQENLFKRIEKHVTGERQAVDQALEQLRQEAATADEQALTKIETVQADQEKLFKLVVEQEQQLLMLQTNWAVRIARVFNRIFRRSKN